MLGGRCNLTRLMPRLCFPTAGRQSTASFLSMRKFIDVCEALELTRSVTVLPKDGKVRPQALGLGQHHSRPHARPAGALTPVGDREVER